MRKALNGEKRDPTATKYKSVSSEPVSYTHLDVYKRQQLVFFIPFLIIPNSRSVDFVVDRLRERGSLPATFYILTRVFTMANDKNRKFKQIQIIFCIQP